MKSEIGKYIKYGLKKEGMLQKDLALLLKRSNSTISEWINGKKIPPAHEFLEIVKILGLAEEIFPECFRKNNDIQSGLQEEQQAEIEKLRRRVERLEKQVSSFSSSSIDLYTEQESALAQFPIFRLENQTLEDIIQSKIREELSNTPHLMITNGKERCSS